MKNIGNKIALAAVITAGLALAGCAQPYTQQPAYGQQSQYNNGSGQLVGKPNQARNAALGAAAGAAVGQLWGKDTEATVTGAVVGGLIGSQVNTPN